MKNLFTYVMALTCLMAVSGRSQATLIDFESFNVGDGLTEINAGVAGLGVSFDAINQDSLKVIIDPNDASNKVLSALTNPSGADILINFNDGPMDFFQVEYVDNPDGVNIFIPINARDHTGTADTIIGSGGDLGSDLGNEPDILAISIWGIRSVQMESGSGFIYVDNIEFNASSAVPIPPAMLLFASGLAVITAFKRRKKT